MPRAEERQTPVNANAVAGAKETVRPSSGSAVAAVSRRAQNGVVGAWPSLVSVRREAALSALDAALPGPECVRYPGRSKHVGRDK